MIYAGELNNVFLICYNDFLVLIAYNTCDMIYFHRHVLMANVDHTYLPKPTLDIDLS